MTTVGSAQVGVVLQPTRDNRYDQWAAYRHPDGTVVFVAQGRHIGHPLGDEDDAKALTELPFSVAELAALAVDQRFHLQ